MIKDYYSLAKPGIIYGNLITMVGGFALASRGGFNAGLLLAAAAGLSLVIASGCAFNNYIDRDIDARMERTKGRPLVAGRVTGRAAVIYASVLGVAGFGILAALVNLVSAAAAAAGFFFYVVAYTLWTKRRTVHGTLVGSISGAAPPVVGYCAASGRFDGGAIILFLILALWQMPHFYAIGIYRRGEYAAAGIPILPVVRGAGAAKRAMLSYVIAFAVAAFLLAAFGYVGAGAAATWYLVVAAVLCGAWLGFSFAGFRAPDDARWARGMFLTSLAVLVVLFAAIAVAGALRA